MAIHVENLEKTFRVRLPQKGFKGTLKGLFCPVYQTVEAVRNISFAVKAGERVAFVGPNGAGKSTTIKILTGILHPTSGSAKILGKTPWQDRHTLSYRIGAVFGQRSQLWYHLPAGDTFDLLAKIYDLSPAAYQDRRRELVDKFDIAPLLVKPVRQLSLGERMRCEIVASLLHRPQILFLDEPTIGLDVTAKAIIRDLIRESSENEGTTVLLTSHDTGDMEQVCERIIVIDHGSLLLDEPVSSLKASYINKRIITLATKEEDIDLSLPGLSVLSKMPHKCVLEVDLAQTSIESVVKAALERHRLRDLMVEDPPMEDVIKEIYRRNRR